MCWEEKGVEHLCVFKRWLLEISLLLNCCWNINSAWITCLNFIWWWMSTINYVSYTNFNITTNPPMLVRNDFKSIIISMITTILFLLILLECTNVSLENHCVMMCLSVRGEYQQHCDHTVSAAAWCRCTALALVESCCWLTSSPIQNNHYYIWWYDDDLYITSYSRER